MKQKTNKNIIGTFPKSNLNGRTEVLICKNRKLRQILISMNNEGLKWDKKKTT